ncbi:MAG: aconitate hydratase AcnA [Candidatus Eremiobacteraeota bacterium]|nr:aconitate hydratase AcnA [Candidatus Eremiobacteraeota bacterium]MBV9699068.1 aconitate hydratase AcnA [Candidatus Eremiobacteraeota bacterium]
MTQSRNSFGSLDTLRAGDCSYRYFRLDALERAGIGTLSRLPFSLKILLENLLRCEDDRTVTRDDIEALARWNPQAKREREIAFTPARVLLQDFTGVPCVVDLAAMRDAMADMGGDSRAINPLQPVELVIDHSVQADYFGSNDALAKNTELEFARNRERYAFLKWGQAALSDFRVVPPGTGIVHQVNIEYLARVVFGENGALAYPDTAVGTDSHTTMVNGLGVLAWGVGGIEAEAAMLGQPVTMLIPEVIGFRLEGALREGVTATDLVLTVAEMLRRKGVVGKFVEFYGTGVGALPVVDRTTISNMSPEFGSTVAIFPIDDRTLEYLRLTGRRAGHVALVEAYAKAQGLFRTDATADPDFADTLALDLASVEPSLAGPRRPQDRVALRDAKHSFGKALAQWAEARARANDAVERFVGEGGGGTATISQTTADLDDGAVVIAAITSCTNTSNPSVLIGAGLLARNAVQRGLRTQPWVKTSLAPGSKVVTDYLQQSGLQQFLDMLGFNLIGYGCTTCIGNSGPLPPDVAETVADRDLIVAAVLSGNRNFEGRIHPQVRANYLASPPLVVAYALAGRMDVDLTAEPLGNGSDGTPVMLADIWPSDDEIEKTIARCINNEMFEREYADVFAGDANWNALEVPTGERYAWDPRSEYVKKPPYFAGMPAEPPPLRDVRAARALVVLGDSVTTDHISPAGSIARSSPAGRYLMERGIEPRDFNSYGARRGNHEIMVRGTFANVRLRNALVPDVEGGVTRYLPSGEELSIFDAAMKYRAGATPLIVLAGKEYGSGSSRDWAAKGPHLLGVTAVIAESLERIHRSNLIGMGILPLEFLDGADCSTFGLTGEEIYDITGIAEGIEPQKKLRVKATDAQSGNAIHFEVRVRIDTPNEAEYYRHGGILQYVLRQLKKTA